MIFNTKNDKKYIGQTKTTIIRNGKEKSHSSKDRFNAHIREAMQKDLCGSVALNRAIRKYGKECFDVKVLKNCDQTMLNELEKKYIIKYNSMCPNGYNIRSGGSDGFHCEESRERMRQAKLGDKNHNFGKPRSDETKEKISNAKKGEKHHFYGKTFTEDHKLKLSQSHKADKSLPMYLTEVLARPDQYQGPGYAVTNHPNSKNKYFTSKKLSMEEKYELAKNYLDSLN